MIRSAGITLIVVMLAHIGGVIVVERPALSLGLCWLAGLICVFALTPREAK